MQLTEIIHKGFYRICDANDLEQTCYVIAKYDLATNTFKSKDKDYPLECAFDDNVRAADGDKLLKVQPLPITVSVLSDSCFDLIFDGTVSDIYEKTQRDYIVEVRMPKNSHESPLVEIYEKGKRVIKKDVRAVHELQQTLRVCGLDNL